MMRWTVLAVLLLFAPMLASHVRADVAGVQSASVLECLRKNPNAWLITAYGGAFFERYLKQQGDALARLNGKGLATYLQR